jgi:tryptophanyl-tRNA synthetase
VLWDDDGLPLAVVEAKKTMENANKGDNQAQLYAECIEKMYGRRPVMYYSNGFETYLWDDQFYKKSRLVHGFYTKKELQTLMFRRENREDIREQPIDTTITDRAYQLRAIRSVAAHFAGNDKENGKLLGTHRAALLVLATGTGKTRISIALSKLLLEANWAKRILFLADRKSLVSQAKNNFVKLMPEHSCVNLLQEKDNVEARIAFSTNPTLMVLIDGSKEKDKRFYGVGHFDLIIVDEAHRSIYKKYQAIFDYFDALFLGLTATPKNSIDKNTYSSFGLADKTPTDAYTFDEAVANKHLMPYNSIKVPTKFLTGGIHYDELSEEEKEEYRGRVGVGLFDYPVLMAADILLYDTAVVPVGEDQVQHVELARTLARRFNDRFGETFVVPEPRVMKDGARIMALDDPTKKMSKSAASAYNFIALSDDPELARKKIMKAVTDSGSEILYSDDKPALKNLITIYSLLGEKDANEIVAMYQGKGYADFKRDLAEIVASFLSDFQKRFPAISDDEAVAILRVGAEKARVVASAKMLEVKRKVGFLG